MFVTVPAGKTGNLNLAGEPSPGGSPNSDQWCWNWDRLGVRGLIVSFTHPKFHSRSYPLNRLLGELFVPAWRVVSSICQWQWTPSRHSV